MLVGLLMISTTAVQWWYWGWYTKPTTSAVFHVSMEALAFAAYAVFGNAITLRKAQHVQSDIAS